MKLTEIVARQGARLDQATMPGGEESLTRIFKQFNLMQIFVRVRRILWSKPRICSEYTYCTEEDVL